ncbi:MAG: hypothetical protein ACRER2_07880 [Methylococcales bacterium]
MNVREALGFALILVALILVPIAWMFSRVLWLVAFGLLLMGSILFYSVRMIKRELDLEKETGGCGTPGTPLPSDIHDYTGWGSGGRSETMDSDFGSGGGDGE